MGQGPDEEDVMAEQIKTADAGLFLDKLKAPPAQKIKGPTKGDRE